MDIFELCILTFMFVRNKNTEVGNKFGPDSAAYDEEMDKIGQKEIEG